MNLFRRDRSLSPIQEDVLFVLSFSFKNKNAKSNAEKKIIDFQNQNQATMIDRRKFIEKIKTKSIKETLLEINFQVPLNQSLILSMREALYGPSQQMTDVFVIGFLIQGLAYIKSDSKNIESGKILLHLFPQILHYPNPSKIISVYTFFLKEYLTELQNTIDGRNFNSIMAFLTYCSDNQIKLPEDFSEVFFLLMELCKNSEVKAAVSDLFSICLKLNDSNILFFSITENQTFIDIVRTYIKVLDVTGIKFLYSIASLNDDCIETILSLYATMADAFNESIVHDQSDDNRNLFIEQNLNEFPQLKEINEIQYENLLKSMPTFEYNENEVTPLFSYSNDFSISMDFTPEYIQNHLNIIMDSFCKVNIQYILAFIEKVMNFASQKENLSFYGDFFSLIVFFVNYIQYFDDKFIRFLMSPIIFHSSKFSSFIVDKENNPCYYYYYLRYSVFQLMNNQKKMQNQLINDLLILAAKSSPFIYAEMLLYVLKNLNSFSNLSVFCSNEQIKALMSVLIELQKLYSTENDDDKSIKLARMICFDFLFKLINDSKSFSIIISNKDFSEGIANFIYEPSLSSLIIGLLLNAISNYHVNVNDPQPFTLHPVFNAILQTCTEKLEDEKYKELGKNLIRSIFVMVKNNPNLILYIYFNFVNLLKFSKESLEISFLDDIFNFISIAFEQCKHYKITSDAYEVFVNFMNQILIEKNELADKVKLLFLKLLAGKEIDSLNKRFVIKYENVIPVFIASFAKYKEFNEILSIFKELCEYSPSNCVKCHDGELDYFLVFFMMKKSEFLYDKKQISFVFDIQQNHSIIFELISQIIRYKTSPFICDKLIQMMTLLSPDYQANDIKDNLELISTVVDENVNKMDPILNLITNQTVCNVKGFTNVQMNNLVFQFNLKLDVPQMMEIPDEYIIALFKGVDDIQYKFSIVKNHIVVKISNQNDKKEMHPKKELPSNKWISISFILQKNDPKLLEFYVDGEFNDRICTTSFQFMPGDVSVTLGTSVSSSEEYSNLKIGEIGTFYFSTVVQSDDSNEQMKNFYFSSSKILDPSIQEDYEITDLKDYEDKSNLNNVLIEHVDLNKLTDIYSKCQIEDKDLLFTFLKMIISLLSSAKLEHQDNYRSVLLLAESTYKLFGRNLNYTVYLEIFSQLEKIISQNLTEEIFKCIIFNISMWCLADAPSIVNIIQHLNQNSVYNFSQYFNNELTVSRLITMYKFLFFDSDLASIKIQNVYPLQKYHSQKDVQMIKKEFFDFIEGRMKTLLTYDDIKTIYSHLLDATNRDEIMDYLTLIINLNQEIKDAYEKQESKEFDLITPLFQLLALNNFNVIVNTLMAIKCFSNKKIHLYHSIVSNILFESVDDVHKKLLETKNLDPNLYSLICSLALLGGKEKIISTANFINKLNTNENRSQVILDDGYMWALWPICIGLYIKKSQRSYIAKFLLKQITRDEIISNLYSNFVNIYNLIGFLSRKWLISAYYLQSEFMQQLLEFVFDPNQTNVINNKIDFLIFSFANIFFEKNLCPRNRPLYKGIIQSPFKSESNIIEYDIGYDNCNDSFPYRPKHFRDLYYTDISYENKEPVLDFNDKRAKDFSGVRTEASSYAQRYNSVSTKTLFSSSYKALFTVNEDDDDDDDDDDNNNNISNGEFPIHSFDELLLAFQNPHKQENKEFIFQVKISNSREWVDSFLCKNLVQYSRDFSQQNKIDQARDQLIKKFISISEYIDQKYRKIEQDENQSQSQNSELDTENQNQESVSGYVKNIQDFQKFELNIRGIKDLMNKLKINLDSNEIFDILEKEIINAHEIKENEKNETFNSANDMLINDLKNEIQKVKQNVGSSFFTNNNENNNNDNDNDNH